MKGWVYVISNAAMPGLAKVGYSAKDPELRAKELNHTGSPHPYVVDYEVLIDEPYEVEQEAHTLLSAKREAKEWFRCSPEEAVAAIKQAAGSRVITETYKRVERARAEALHQQKLRDREASLKAQHAERARAEALAEQQARERVAALKAQQEAERAQAEALHQQQLRDREASLKTQQAELRRQQTAKEVENRFAAEEAAIRQKFDSQLASMITPAGCLWIGLATALALGNLARDPSQSAGVVIVFAVILAGIATPFLHFLSEKQSKNSAAYRSLVSQQQAELEAVRFPIAPCPSCGKQIRFDRAAILRSDHPNSTMMCPNCRGVVWPPST